MIVRQVMVSCLGVIQCFGTENHVCLTCPLLTEDFSRHFSLRMIAEDSFSNNNISCIRMIRRFQAELNCSQVNFTGLAYLMVPLT